MQGSQAGSVVALWRYPVKSMMGEELNSSEVTQRGLLGDRAYALVDAETGKVASAKNPRPWPRLLDFRAPYTEPPRKRAKLPPVRFEVRRFRPHIVVETAGEAGFVENAWLNRTAAIGHEVGLRVFSPCARCVMSTLPLGGRPRDRGVLRGAAQYNNANVGVYA